ncbi:SEP-domain-containing protein [Eremomyces bilateralis CBS 781.70]|uniref:SEP-domain-containing protein n=1 Tax=Eremomyces bilateralis CBS 781.70 TaxID=1392243 RepID=A0A6G1G383_9PEZI|nr:SEP-domain-containing protein [Eremomyces bilateralis CBS 781.70]KAF1812376.1 SEP-domain-containing protein [Eremomyces bilateralis CBS 781.70]
MAPPTDPNRRRTPGRPVTLGDLQNSGSSAPQAHSHDDGDDSDDQDFFAGGEKSGLAVQNPNSGPSSQPGSGPNRFINSIIDRARQNVPRPGGEDEVPTQSRFSGPGQTLGGDDAPSVIIPGAGSSSSTPPPRVLRRMHLWRDGFSIDDGALYRYDDPNNAEILEMINSGRAPMSILDVQQGQEVNLEVHPHREEDYKPPTKKWKPFVGAGNRLGSPVPGAETSSTSTPTQSAEASASSANPPAITVDDSVPAITLQIRLGDGTSLRSQFNTTHTIGDVYNFVDAAARANTERPYVLMTTFPSTELKDKAAVLGDMAEFKRGGVVVQRWT